MQNVNLFIVDELHLIGNEEGVSIYVFLFGFNDVLGNILLSRCSYSLSIYNVNYH